MRNSKDDHRLFVIKHLRFSNMEMYYLTDAIEEGNGAIRPCWEQCLLCAAQFPCDVADEIAAALVRDQSSQGTFWLVPLVIAEGEAEAVLLPPSMQ